MESFTVVIPTRDRCETLACTLESCIAQPDGSFRILVSDNHSRDDTRLVVESFQRRDSRVEYIQPPRPMGMSSNWEFVLGQVKEGFVLLLGADDGLMPGAVSHARELLRSHPSIEAIHSDAPGYYYPEVTSERAGHLYLQARYSLEIRKPGEWLAGVANMTCAVTDLPYIYQSTWVRADVLQRIAAKSGRLIHSAVPDVFLAIAVASQVELCLHVSHGFGIGGYSRSSNWAATTQPRGNRNLEERFKTENEIPFHPSIGYTRSVPLIVGESFLRAKDAGLLPAGFPIPWDRIIARAYQHLLQETWNAEEMDQHLTSLWNLAGKMGCEGMFQTLCRLTSEREMLAKNPFLEEWRGVTWEVMLDTLPLQIRGINEAARIAGMLQKATKTAPGSASRILDADNGQLLAWSLLQLGAESADLQAGLQRISIQSQRIAIARDQARAELLDLRGPSHDRRTNA